MLFETARDWSRLHFLAAEAAGHRRTAVTAAADAIQAFAHCAGCRHAYLLEYLGEHAAARCVTQCDHCCAGEREVELGAETRILLRAVHACGGRCGLGLPLELLRGAKSQRMLAHPALCRSTLYGAAARFGRSGEWWRLLGEQLLARGLLKQRSLPGTHTHGFRVVGVAEAGDELLKRGSDDEPPSFMLDLPVAMRVLAQPALLPARNASAVNAPVPLTAREEELVARLSRSSLDPSGEPASVLLDDRSMRLLARTRPSDMEGLRVMGEGVFVRLGACATAMLCSLRHASAELGLGLDNLSGEQHTRRLHRQLHAWRASEAAEAGIAPYVSCRFTH